MKHYISGNKIGLAINLTIDGKMYYKNCPSEAQADLFFEAIIDAQLDPTNDAIETLLGHLNQNMRIAKENGLEYDMETGLTYLEGYNTPIPELLVKTIEEYYEKGYPMEAWVNFWKLLMINPDKRVRESLFEFIKTHNFSVTDNGYMVVYKSVEFFDNAIQNDLNTFITNAAYHVRKDWRCSPAKYAVYADENDVYHITKETTIKNWDLEEKGFIKMGNLKKLEDTSKDLSEKDDAVKFIPMHVAGSRNSFDLDKETVRLGVPQKMERGECDSDPQIDCSYGLHVGSTKYVERFANSGSAILTCFVSPAHVIAVPDYDHSKMRVCEYFPYSLNERVDGNINAVEQAYFEHDYMEYETEELERQIQAINDEEERVGVDVMEAEDERDIEEVLKALKSRVIELQD